MSILGIISAFSLLHLVSLKLLTFSWENLAIASSSRLYTTVTLAVPLTISFTARTLPELEPSVHVSSHTTPNEPLPRCLVRCHLSCSRIRRCCEWMGSRNMSCLNRIIAEGLDFKPWVDYQVGDARAWCPHHLKFTFWQETEWLSLTQSRAASFPCFKIQIINDKVIPIFESKTSALANYIAEFASSKLHR